MKSRITFSTFATILTAVLIAAMFIGCILTVKEPAMFFCFLAIYLILFVSALFYGAAYIKVDNDNIVMGSLLRSKKIPLDEVESVRLFQPTMGAIRVFASGGFMGYWGVFREGDVGKYYGFYGKASDCFLVRLKDGKQYVLGCDDPAAVVAYIDARIH